MDTTDDVATTFSQAVLETTAGRGDLNELLVVAERFLRMMTADDGDDRLTAARTMAHRACDHAVFDTDETLAQLRCAAKAYAMTSRLHLLQAKTA